MRLSRVPVLSLDQHDLVYDPGGLHPVSPVATGRIRRSSGVRLSAVPTPEDQAAVDSPRSVRLRTAPRFSRQEADEALTSSRAIPVSA